MSGLSRRSGAYNRPVLSAFVLLSLGPWTSSVTNPEMVVGDVALLSATVTESGSRELAAEPRRNARL